MGRACSEKLLHSVSWKPWKQEVTWDTQGSVKASSLVDEQLIYLQLFDCGQLIYLQLFDCGQLIYLQLCD